MNNLKLSSPWETYRNKLAAFFELDECVTVGDVTDIDGGKTVTVSVTNRQKAAALEKVLRKRVEFGNVVLTVTVYDASGEETLADVLKAAFAYNETVRRVMTGTDHTGTEHIFVICEPDVVQFFNDDISDYQGNFNALAADVARELFDAEAHFNTADLREN